MGRVVVLTIALAAGCGFSGAGSVDAADVVVDAAIDAPIDGPDPLPGLCGAASEDSLVMCHDFEEMSTTVAADGSQYGNHAVLRRVTPTTRLAPNGQTSNAAGCNGTCELRIAESPSLDVTGEITLSLWVRPDDAPVAGARYYLLDNNSQYALWLRDDLRATCAVYRNPSAAVAATTPPLAAAAWSQLTCVVSGGTLVMYVDGEFVGSTSFAAFPINTNNSKGTLLAEDLEPNGNGEATLRGELDDVRVWSRALSPNDICVQAKLPGCF